MRLGWMMAPVASLLAVAGLLALPVPDAKAPWHLMSVREVFPGTLAAPDGAFIELQMYRANQNFVLGHSVTIYDAAGTETAEVPMDSNVPNGQNQRTILLADSDVSNRDFDANIGTLVPPSGGAVCFEEWDCVAWGNFAAPEALPGEVGTPAVPAGIPDGFSITRTIEPNCATLLEAEDDSNDSATDFFETAPTPRGNSVEPTEKPCDGSGDGTTGPAPSLKVGGKKRQDVDRVSLRVRSDEAATIVGSGRIPLRSQKRAGRKRAKEAKRVVRFKRVRRAVEPGETTQLRFRANRSDRRMVKRALKNGKLVARLRVKATDAEGNSTIKRRRVQLKR